MIYVIADDLTGAAEIAGICARYGLLTSFSLGEVRTVDAYDAHVIATETRQQSLSDARKEIRKLCEALPTDALLFKKTDSAFRGHVEDELYELLQSSRYLNCLYIPANPSRGRVIKGGIYYIDGIPLDKTPFSTDPEYPAWSSKIEERFPNMKYWKQANERGLYYADATCREDLDKLIKQAGRQTLLAGGADLFEQFLTVLGHSVSNEKPLHQISFNDALMVCGSTQSKGMPDWPASMMPHSTYQGENNTDVWVDDALSLLNQYGHVQLRMPTAVSPDALKAAFLKSATAEAVALLLQQYPIREVYIEGGATAYSILERMGWKDLTLSCEYAPGVVRMEHAAYGITLKPGSYPWPW